MDAVGKNLLLEFEGGLVLRSHLRMKGRWQVRRAGAPLAGRPFLVLRGSEHDAVLWHGPVLELGAGAVRGLGPDILAEPPELDRMVALLRAADPAREVGDALLDQRLVSGIGNLWRAEALWEERLSPWTPLRAVDDAALRGTLLAAHRLMREGLELRRRPRAVYRRRGRACPRCGTPIRSRAQGEHARTAYWCPGCQVGEEPPGA